MKNIIGIILCSLFAATLAHAQKNIILQGYIFETDNRGYISMVEVTAYNNSNNAVLATITSDEEGKFSIQLPVGPTYKIKTRKDLFHDKETLVATADKADQEKVYHKIEMERKPGYIFDVTIAPKRESPDDPVEAIEGAWIEIYNNTTKEEVLNLKNHPFPYFKATFEQGHHYTIMIRKKGYLNRRMEAYVNVEGCILCFEGVGKVEPGVSDVLTAGHTMGTLLANVELEPVEIEKTFELKNIYYEYNKWNITEKAAIELDKVVLLLKDNPALVVELGSHTDSRGKTAYNQELSNKRAKSAVDYIVAVGGIDRKQIAHQGYGESQLVNGCADGVECSERKHQENRRTEIKIIGITSVDPLDQKSLAQIKEEEQMEELIKALGNQEVIKVKPGDELPDEIKKQIEGSEEKTKPEKMKHPPTDAGNAGELVPATKVEEKIEAVDDASEEFDKPIGEQESMSLIVKETEIAIQPLAAGNTKSLPSDFEGYMIEFFTSNRKLPADHPIFANHGSITLEQTTQGKYAYLLGDFGDWRDANKFLNSIMLSKYPNARIIRYKKGKRLTY